MSASSPNSLPAIPPSSNPSPPTSVSPTLPLVPPTNTSPPAQSPPSPIPTAPPELSSPPPPAVPSPPSILTPPPLSSVSPPPSSLSNSPPPPLSLSNSPPPPPSLSNSSPPPPSLSNSPPLPLPSSLSPPPPLSLSPPLPLVSPPPSPLSPGSPASPLSPPPPISTSPPPSATPSPPLASSSPPFKHLPRSFPPPKPSGYPPPPHLSRSSPPLQASPPFAFISPPPADLSPTPSLPPSSNRTSFLSPPPSLANAPSPPRTTSPLSISVPQNPSNPTVNVSTGNINSGKSSFSQTSTTIAVGVGIFIVIFILVGVIFWCVRKKRRSSDGYAGGYSVPIPFSSSYMSDSPLANDPTPFLLRRSGSEDFQYSQPEMAGLRDSKSWFTYKELSDATNGFSTHNVLGEGGFGPVYKGLLLSGREVAVKQLKVGSSQGEREFQAEVEIISRIHHRHLVSLVGYCIYDNQRLLVYDYVPNNTLSYHLHGENMPVIDWSIRIKIAIGAARGITYLHEDCHPRIIHRDIKSSNILLDNNFEARVSDFGLAKLSVDSMTHVTTRVMGTFGYLAPEYASSGKLTDKSDVYSFGVVLLELITGRKPVDPSQPLGDESLVEWARPLLTHAMDGGDYEELIDKRLGKNYRENEMFRMIEAAAACVRHTASMRPRMGQVVRNLEFMSSSSDLHNGVIPGQSTLFDSGEQSAEIRMFRRMAFGEQDYSINDFSESSYKI